MTTKRSLGSSPTALILSQTWSAIASRLRATVQLWETRYVLRVRRGPSSRTSYAELQEENRCRSSHVWTQLRNTSSGVRSRWPRDLASKRLTCICCRRCTVFCTRSRGAGVCWCHVGSCYVEWLRNRAIYCVSGAIESEASRRCRMYQKLDRDAPLIPQR